MLEITVIRAIVLLLSLNFADHLNLLPEGLHSFSFLWVFNTLTLLLTLIYLILWLSQKRWMLQLCIQTGVDLVLTTLLIANTHGIESPFVVFYLLIIMYCSLTLGRNGGMGAAAFSSILYAGTSIAMYLNLFGLEAPKMITLLVTFRISTHALGFWAVAYLGAYLQKRLQVIEGELKEKINSLTQLQRLTERIVSSIRSGLITTDLRGRVTVFNAAARELTGKDPQEIVDKPVQMIIGEAFWTQILEANLLQNAKPLRHEAWFVLPGGAQRFLGFSTSPLIDQNLQLLGYIISFQDLTEIRRLEDEVRLKERMAAIGRMASGIAHEIRNPLTAMRGSVEILRSHATLPETDDRLLQILIRESDRLNKFIEDFLNFARPKTYAKQPIDLIPVLKDSVTLLRNSPEIRDKHALNLKIETPSIRILGNADQLNQVFWNLAQNAVRAMPKGGDLNVSARKISDTIGQVVFQDSGIGMSLEEKAQLFQPFQSGFAGGLGLGLSITFQIMEDHQGKMTFESEKGKGTKVTLNFPLELAAKG